MRKYFFDPFVGKNYLEGIRGKKILVVGASFYCNESSRCQFFKDCTDVIKKDSSAYDTRCEFNGGYPLRQEPEFNIGNHYRAYEVFGSFMQKISGDTCYADVWNRMAFTNYVQFFLPANDGRSRPTYYTDTSDRDFDAFIEIVKKLSPDIVIVWGCAIASAVKEDNKYLVDNGKEELEDTEYYVCHIRAPGMDYDVAIINPYHPVSSKWWSGLSDFEKYLLGELPEA